jgi:hypothetical protein
MAEGRVQFVTSHTPELSWPAGSTVHANGADRLTDLLLCVDDPNATAARYARYVSRPVSPDRDLSAVRLDRGRLVFAGPDAAAAVLPDLVLPSVPFIAGQALASAGIAATRAALRDGGIEPVFQDSELLCVSPDDALGAYLLFHAGSVTSPWTALQSRL